MVFIEENNLRDQANYTKTVKTDLPPKLSLNSEFRISTNRFPEIQKPSPETLQIFVVGPSIHGKTRILEYFTSHNLMIPEHTNMFLAFELNGLMLKGIDVIMNFWHVGHIERSISILQHLYKLYKTSFMLIYDVNDYTTFDDVHQWIPSLRRVLNDEVKIVLVGYEDISETETSRTLPISYSEGAMLSTFFKLECFYEFSDLTGTSVSDMFFEAAHIALESKKTTTAPELLEMEGKIIPRFS